MVGIHYEELKIRQQEVEVRALAALLNCDDRNVREDAMLKLCNFAFPEMLVELLEEDKKQTKLGVD